MFKAEALNKYPRKCKCFLSEITSVIEFIWKFVPRSQKRPYTWSNSVTQPGKN